MTSGKRFKKLFLSRDLKPKHRTPALMQEAPARSCSYFRKKWRAILFTCHVGITFMRLFCVLSLMSNISQPLHQVFPFLNVFQNLGPIRIMKYLLIISGTEDEIVCSKISPDERKDFIHFCKNELTKMQSREDNKELIQLAITSLGEEHFKFKKPGATSHARWMSEAIYCFKIFLFRTQFGPTKRETDGLRDICIFLVKMFVRAWFGSTNAICAPLQDLKFIKDGIKYSETDADISAAVIKKMSNHLWYLNDETVALAIFDSKVPFAEKREMVEKLNSKEPVVKLKNGQNHSNLIEFEKNTISDFISEKSKKFFSHFGLFSIFFKLDPST